MPSNTCAYKNRKHCHAAIGLRYTFYLFSLLEIKSIQPKEHLLPVTQNTWTSQSESRAFPDTLRESWNWDLVPLQTCPVPFTLSRKCELLYLWADTSHWSLSNAVCAGTLLLCTLSCASGQLSRSSLGEFPFHLLWVLAARYICFLSWLPEQWV